MIFGGVISPCATVVSIVNFVEKRSVSFGRLMKTIFGLVRILVSIRVPFHRQASIRLFDFLLRSIARNAEYLVWIHGALDERLD